jgi:hypothetical protein
MTARTDGVGRKPHTKPFPKNTKFVCPKCSISVIMHIPITFRPVCTRHAGRETHMLEA